MPQLRGQQHGHVVDVHRVRGCAVSWTLRPQRTRDLRQGERQEHTAALRASRYVRRHAWQFHGAGAEEAVEKLTGLKEFCTASNAMKDAMTKFAEHVSVVMNVPVGLALSYEDAAEAVTSVVGWRSPSGLLLCLKHPHREAAPVTSVLEGATCAVCGEQLGAVTEPEPSRPSLTAKCLCTHPYSSHNVNGLCIALPGVLGCGCMGWSEVRT